MQFIPSIYIHKTIRLPSLSPCLLLSASPAGTAPRTASHTAVAARRALSVCTSSCTSVTPPLAPYWPCSSPSLFPLDSVSHIAFRTSADGWGHPCVASGTAYGTVRTLSLDPDLLVLPCTSPRTASGTVSGPGSRAGAAPGIACGNVIIPALGLCYLLIYLPLAYTSHSIDFGTAVSGNGRAGNDPGTSDGIPSIHALGQD